MSDIQHITSRDNPVLMRLRKLAGDAAAYRKIGSVWLEGDHLAPRCAGPCSSGDAGSDHRGSLE